MPICSQMHPPKRGHAHTMDEINEKMCTFVPQNSVNLTKLSSPRNLRIALQDVGTSYTAEDLNKGAE